MGTLRPKFTLSKGDFMKKKVIFLIAALLCVVLLFAACTKKDEEPEVENTEVVLVSNGETQFVVVGDESSNHIKTFLTSVERLLGAAPTVHKTLEEAPADKVKIVFGNPETLGLDELVPEVPYFGYLVKASGGNIYVLAYSDSMHSDATSFLYRRMEELYVENNLAVAGDYAQTKGAETAPYLEGGENARIYDCDTDHQMVLLDKVEKAEFEAYVAKLAAEGFSLHSENNMNGNLFKTYAKDGSMLHTYWVEYSKEVRTIVAKTTLLPINSTGGNNSLTTPSVHQLRSLGKNDVGILDGGLGFVIELADGRFIIVDGGSNHISYSKEIYDYLKYAANDPDNIVIATWYISHYHGDHGGAFRSFAQNYAGVSSIKLESIMYNQCMNKEQTVYLDVSGHEALLVDMSKYYPTVPVYKPLTGQKYTFSTTTIEILYTMPDFMPNVIGQEADYVTKGEANGNGNTQTMVAMFDIVNNADKNDRLIVTGDTVKAACDEMVARYKTYLQCDMVQVSHHGHGSDSTDPAAYARRLNSTKEFYQYTNPTIAFWPTGNSKFAERKVHSVNAYLCAVITKNGGRHIIAETSTNSTNTIVFS